MGASIDHINPNPNPGRPVSAFFFGLGLGDRLTGIDLRSFANGNTQQQLGRLSVDLVGVLRPLAALGDDTYAHRVLRSASLDVGPGIERASVSHSSSWRAGLVLGLHVDLPIGPPATKELRLRLGVRRLVGTSATVASVRVKDSTAELYAQLAFVF